MKNLVISTALLFLAAGAARGENAFSIDDQRFPPDTGEQQIRIPVRCDNDDIVFGFSLGIRYDPTMLTVTGVTKAGTAAEDADFFLGSIDAGGSVGWACIFDTDGDFNTQKLDPGTNQVIAILEATLDTAGEHQTELSFADVATNPDPSRLVKNRMSGRLGASIVPVLRSGTILVGRSPFTRGDCNTDGTPDISDTVFHLEALFRGGPTSDCADGCDSNDDSSLDVSDAVWLLNFLFLAGDPPPAPFPGCGSDPQSEGALGCENGCE